MKIKIDYHFHPNLSKNENRANNKCKKIWAQFKKKKINAVIITEHAYKNPKRAFNLLKKHKPNSMFCFPGIECVTKEGIDIIVFSNNEKIYGYKELRIFQLSYFDLIKFVNSKKDLYAFVTHPYAIGLNSVINKLGSDAYFKSLNLLNAVEISNGSFDNLLSIINRFSFSIFFMSKLKKIKKTKNLPKSEYPFKIKFLAVGSDAHHVEGIGNCYQLESDLSSLNEDDVFKLVTNNKGKGRICYDNSKSFNFWLLIKTGLTLLNEFIIKQTLKFNIDKK